MTAIKMDLFGDPIIYIYGNVFDGPEKTKALIIYLALNYKDGPHTRRKVAYLIWPNKIIKKSRHNLTDALSKLKTSLVKEGLSDAVCDLKNAEIFDSLQNCVIAKSSKYLQFNSCYDYFCDVEEFEALTERMTDSNNRLEDLERAYELYRGDFLGDFHIGNNEEFEEWVLLERRRLELQFHELLSVLSIRYLISHNYRMTIKYLDRLLIENPYNVPAYYGLLMICYTMVGQINSAEETYKKYKETSVSSTDEIVDEVHNLIRQKVLSNHPVQNQIDKAIAEIKDVSDTTLKTFFDAITEKGIGLKMDPSDRYKDVLRLAFNEATAGGFQQTGTPHLFFALVAKDKDRVHQMFNTLNLDLTAIVQTMHNVLGKGNNDNAYSSIEKTLGLENVLQTANDLAIDYGTNSIDLPHLWIALLQNKDSLLVQILELNRISPNDLIDIVAQSIR